MGRPVHRRILGFMAAALLVLTGMSQSNALSASDPNATVKFQAAFAGDRQAIEDKDSAAAVTAAREALDIGRSVLADDGPSMAALHINYGTALVGVRLYEEAIAPLPRIFLCSL
ncbi:MAG: hypothetical protein IH996_08260 [Proteobacteria bacterium]|nr:hypothetical protein [Pseudomonadota bacterium]